MPLITRRTHAPGGWQYFQPQTHWHVPNPMLEWDVVVRQIQQHRLANPRFSNLWSTQIEEIEKDLDLFTCIRIANDPHYCTGGPIPKAMRPPRGRVAGAIEAVGRSAGAVVEKAKKYVSGVGVLLSWLGSGGKAVSQEQAEKRAAVCAVCPKNEPGGLDSFFTAIAAEKIRSQLALRNEMEMKTSYDSRLNVCTACLCQTKLKVFVPIGHVLSRLKPEMKSELHPDCWILKETNEQH